MRPSTPDRASNGRTKASVAVGLLIALAAAVGAFVVRPTPSSAPPFDRAADPPELAGRDPSRDGASVPDGVITAADGALPDGVGVFDDQLAGVANLDADLLRALREAATDAAEDGIELYVNSGWRSREYQEHLRRAAVAEYGSEAAAARWVSSADDSAHVIGEAVDLGPLDATAWLSTHGAEHGLCRIYDNEPWHFELRPEAVGQGCPPTYVDPTHDPRMQQ